MLVNGGIIRALQQPDLKGRLLADGAQPVGNSPEEFAEYIRMETAKWAKVVRDAGITVE